MARRGAHRELNDWLDHHGYRHAHAAKPKISHPYAVSSRMSHAVRKGGTKADTIAAILATGASVKYRDGEWQVNVPRGTEATAYYTSDGDDAISTARSMMEHARAGSSRAHASKTTPKGDRLFIGTFPTGIRYADKQRERGGDYLPLAFLPYSTLQLEWDRRAPVALGLREQIERHADSIRARRGEAYPISSSGQTVKLGHARMVESPTGREVFASKERDHHITTHGRQTLGAGQFALPPGPEERRRGIQGRLPIDTLKRARNALARATQMKKRGHLSAAQLATVRRKVHAAWPSIAVDR